MYKLGYMRIEQIYTGCLSHAGCYLESKGETAIFGPLREVQPYIVSPNKDNAKIMCVFETHDYDDFVDVNDGYVGIAKTNIDRSEYICPTTML